MPASISTTGSLVRRLDAISVSYLTGFSIGPVARGDTSKGLLNRVWYVRLDGESVYIARANDTNTAWEAEQLLFSFTGDPILEIDLAFDQSAQPVVCAERAGSAGSEIWQYWFDARTGLSEFKYMTAGRTPRVLLDNPHDVTGSDVLTAYIGATSIEFRQQRDYYETAYAVPNTSWYHLTTQQVINVDNIARLFVEEVARTRTGRLAIIASIRDEVEGTYSLLIKESAPYPLEIKGEGWEIEGAIETLRVFEYIIGVEPDADAWEPIGEIETLTLIELIIGHDQPADDAWAPDGKLQTVDTIQLVIAHTQPVEDAWRPLGALQTVDVILYILATATQGPDAWQPVGTLQTVTLSPA